MEVMHERVTGLDVPVSIRACSLRPDFSHFCIQAVTF